MHHVFVHESAIVDEGVNIGEGTKVWHWTHLVSGARVGSSCSLGQNVYVGGKAVIGNGVKIQNNVSIYDNVIIHDSVFCGPSVVFTNVYNPRSEVNRKDNYMTTVVCKGSTLGANSTIVCGVTVGEYSFVGAGAVVNKDIKPFALVVGVPAVQIGWMSANGDRIDLPLIGSGQWLCPVTSKKYILSNDTIAIQD